MTSRWNGDVNNPHWIDSWANRPLRCSGCNVVIEETEHEFTFYCNDCIKEKINALHQTRNP